MSEQKQSQPKKASTLHGLLVGSLAGIAEVGVNQPLIYFKNAMQANLPMTVNPRVLYRGFGTNIASLAPITAIQVGADKALFSLLFESPTHQDATLPERLLTSTSAGMLSGLISGPTEMVVVHQQGKGQSFGEVFNEIRGKAGIGRIFRGTAFAAARDGGFTAGFLVVGPMLATQVRETMGVKNEVAAGLLGGSMAGVLAAVATHPFDTIKVRLQKDAYKTEFPNLWSAVSKPGWYAGFAPRATRVISGVCVISNVTSFMFNWINGGQQ